jgi:urease accessory protein
MAADLPCARAIIRGPVESVPGEFVLLDFDARQVRRRRLVTQGGEAFLADLPRTVGLNEGDAFVLEDGRLIGVVAAAEELMAVRGDLARLAWHIGNRHAPCQIGPDRLLIRRDHVLRGMVEGLGATVTDVVEPFTPEGGAYGEGRIMGHAHGHDHDHDHDLDGDVLAGLGRDAG